MEWLEGGALLGAAVAAGRDALRLLTSLCWLSVVTRVVLSFSGGLACFGWLCLWLGAVLGSWCVCMGGAVCIGRWHRRCHASFVLWLWGLPWGECVCWSSSTCVQLKASSGLGVGGRVGQLS